MQEMNPCMYTRPWLKRAGGILFLSFFICFLPFLPAQVRLPRLISDGMVIQRDATVNLWGWASPNEKIVIRFQHAAYGLQADAEGKWKLELSPSKAGGPYDMIIQESNEIKISNIMIGDVWVCSGQSNMDITMQRVSPIYPDEIANCENPNIRLLDVPIRYDFNTPQQDITSGTWTSTNPQTILGFSAVAYFFAKELYDKNKIPVGLIRVSLGGSPAEAWMSEEALKPFPAYYREMKEFKDSAFIRRIEQADNERSTTWYRQLWQKDEGYKNPAHTWWDPAFHDDQWSTMSIPGYWANTSLGKVNGVVWFHKNIQVPAAMAGQSARLNLGRIVDADSVFLNGTFIGTTSYQYPPRRYEIPAGILKEGTNSLIVRVINNSGQGGFVPDKPYELIASGDTVDLKGDWQYRLGAVMAPLAGPTFIRWKSGGLFNGMLHPLLNYTIKGAIWYQGEANTKKPEEYRTLFPAMIKDWRNHWKQGDFPFLFVQLANFMEVRDQPTESNWAMLREAQLRTLSLPNTGMAVAIDIGEWNDIHPLNKKDVGKRLALAAQKVAYGHTKTVISGPTFKSMQIVGGNAVLTFENAGKRLKTKGSDTLKGFVIAGPDQRFVWAEARIRKNKVIVHSPAVANPVAVRYAWADNPVANLYNKQGLPASPFRTDDWAPDRGGKNDRGLKDYYKNFFPIGVAVSPAMMEPGKNADFILSQFNSLTPENAMKMGPIHPEENRYNWAPADKIVDFAVTNGLKMRGHTLCWHSQTPAWFFTDSTGKDVSKEQLLARLERHIKDVVGRYKGKIYAWDVVNEAVPDGGNEIYRKSKFYEIIGEEYIGKAFEYAHAADPSALLFYNDYNTENASKRDRIYQLIRRLKEKGVPIHGVGLQGHWSIYEPTAQELEESITRFAALGLQVQITELDVSVYPKEHERRASKPSDISSIYTPEMETQQADHYRMLFDIFRKHKDAITGITFWNLSDKSSWLDHFPVEGRKDYPLLFDQNNQPKKAYHAVTRF